MKLSFRRRIATYFMISTAIIIALVFGTVYYIVQKTVYYNLDKDVKTEAEDHRAKVEMNQQGMLYFVNKKHLLASEHTQAQVNPVFIQLIDLNGNFIDKSPNLKQNVLRLKSTHEDGAHYNTSLNGHPIRQVQIKVQLNGKKVGHLLAAMSLEASLMVLKNLRNTLFILYPIILLGLFFISSLLAGRSIQPVVSIIETTDRITKKNLDQRVDLPAKRDELYTLSVSINALLQRIENAMVRERQFTSDASHELRTPISILRGTLEILLRKPRSAEEYHAKIQESLTEVDRLALILDQLLDLARNDESTAFYANEKQSAVKLMNEIIARQSPVAEEQQVSIHFQPEKTVNQVQINAFYGTTILENILSNAIKYSKEKSEVKVDFELTDDAFVCHIQDFGIGIEQEDLVHIFQPFFRSDALKHKSIKGTGLGLSIVQKAAKAIQAEISVKSELGKGTVFSIQFHDFLSQS